MNATILYSKLSRDVLNLNNECNDEKLSEFMKQDRGFFKLRSLLLCRACRELCIEPYSSSFCQHLVCKSCVDEKKARNPGCKWCRNEEDLVVDIQSKILVGLYKQLCAILRDVVTKMAAVENDNKAGCSTDGVKERLLKFLDEGCSLPDVKIPESKLEDEIINKPIRRQRRRKYFKNESAVSCPSCCCNCEKSTLKQPEQLRKEGLEFQNTDITNDPIKITAAQSSEECKDLYKTPIYTSDPVSSTVPDSIPTLKRTVPATEDQNKHGTNKNEKLKPKSADINHSFKVDKNRDNKINKTESSKKLSASKFYETISSISRKKIKKNIFEKYGLALTPNTENIKGQDDIDYTEKLKRKKLHQNSKEKKKKSLENSSDPPPPPPPKIQPLKLTVQKINDQNNDVSYKIQYNINASSVEKNNDRPCNNDSDDKQHMEHNLVLSDSSPDSNRKAKRKATFVTNYAVFSDDSDFELDSQKFTKRTKRPTTPKEDREICGCGAGSNVKYFTDICKRSRCPCYSQGRACVNCKCRFCSNPYLLDDEVIYSDSDSSTDQPLSHWMKDEYEVVDVETM